MLYIAKLKAMAAVVVAATVVTDGSLVAVQQVAQGRAPQRAEGNAASSTTIGDPAVFEAPPTPFSPRIGLNDPDDDAPLRILTIEERMGLARHDELVRTPLFFHKGECRDPDSLVIYAADDKGRKSPIPYQADDVRRGPGGGVARMHVYFYADLKPWQQRQYVVIGGRNPGAKLDSIATTQAGDEVTFAADTLSVTFKAKGPQAGGITAFETPFAKVVATRDAFAPRVKLFRQDEKLKKVRENEIYYSEPESFEVRELKYAAGPLFAKLRVRVRPRGVPDVIESTYLMPARGEAVIATHRMLPEEENTPETVSATWPVFLHGWAKFGDGGETPRVVRIPAGARELTAKTHGFNLEAAVSDAENFSFMNVPNVVWGDHGVYAKEDGELVFMGPDHMQRGGGSNSGSLRAWWFQLRYVLSDTTDEEDLYDVGRVQMQPIVAIVDEPAMTVADLAEQSKEIAQRFNEIEYWPKGWQQKAAIAYLAGDDEEWRALVAKQAEDPKKQKFDPTVAEEWMADWARKQLAAGGKWPLDRPKGGDRDVAQRVEPYPLTYSFGSVPVLAHLQPTERLDRICHEAAKASRWTNGQLYENGWPYIAAFANAYNMQVGSAFAGIYAGKRAGDEDLVRFYRDVTRSPGAIAIYGRGLRNYSGNVQQTHRSDLLYQAISDFWMRVIELTCNEDLMLHPTVYGRYPDAVDVLADLQHRDLGEGKSWHRANFFRTQSHDHRWEAWATAPYMRLLRDPKVKTPVGLTDAVYFTQHRAQRKMNWSSLYYYFYPLVMLRQVGDDYRPPKLPPLPREVEAAPRGAGGVRVTWKPAGGDVAGYRIYRADTKGEPLTFVNTPYGPRGAQLIKGTSFDDPHGTAESFYFVTAVDKGGNESHWFPNEPRP